MRSLAAIAIVAGLAGCGGGGGATSGCPAFTSLVAGDFARTSGTLSWTMQVAQMPATFTLNETGVPDDQVEYEWAVDLDADQDGQPDLSVAALLVHFPGTQQVTVMASEIVSTTQRNLWSYGSDMNETLIGGADVTLTGNVFHFGVPEAEDPRLAQVTTRAQTTWKTRYQFGPGAANTCIDSLAP